MGLGTPFRHSCGPRHRALGNRTISAIFLLNTLSSFSFGSARPGMIPAGTRPWRLPGKRTLAFRRSAHIGCWASRRAHSSRYRRIFPNAHLAVCEAEPLSGVVMPFVLEIDGDEKIGSKRPEILRQPGSPRSFCHCASGKRGRFGGGGLRGNPSSDSAPAILGV